VINFNNPTPDTNNRSNHFNVKASIDVIDFKFDDNPIINQSYQSSFQYNKNSIKHNNASIDFLETQGVNGLLKNETISSSINNKTISNSINFSDSRIGQLNTLKKIR